jgi:hypothetical protein
VAFVLAKRVVVKESFLWFPPSRGQALWLKLTFVIEVGIYNLKFSLRVLCVSVANIVLLLLFGICSAAADWDFFLILIVIWYLSFAVSPVYLYYA